MKKYEVVNATVLYIEDNPANTRLVTKLLERKPHIKLLTADEPGLGLELGYSHKPDLILLDVNLPGMDGYEVLKHIRADDTLSNTPVIALTANAMVEDVEKGQLAGFDEYLTKPINISDFFMIVERYLPLKSDTSA